MNELGARPVVGISTAPPVSYYDGVWLTDEKPPATAGGNFTQADWRDRTVTTERGDDAGLCAIDGDYLGFVLQPGDWWCLIFCPGYKVDSHQARLYDNTNSAVLLYGTTAYSPAADGTTTHSVIVGMFTLAAATDLKIQHYCNTTRNGDGFGEPIGAAGDANTYTAAEFLREHV